MTLRIAERKVREERCAQCGTSTHVTGYVYADDSARCAYFAECHGHPHHEAWIDIVLGTWGHDSNDDHVTFFCQLRATGAMAVDPPHGVTLHPIMGQALSREAALAHPWIRDAWEVVDLVAEADEAVSAAVYGPPSKGWRGRRFRRR